EPRPQLTCHSGKPAGIAFRRLSSFLTMPVMRVNISQKKTAFFVTLGAGLVVNTIFLVREIRRNEQHDSFINAVTHELKTPIASIKLYLETLKSREVDEAKRREFYDVMLADSDRLLQTVEQVLRASQSGQRRRRIHPVRIDFGEIVGECIELARRRYHLA